MNLFQESEAVSAHHVDCHSVMLLLKGFSSYFSDYHLVVRVLNMHEGTVVVVALTASLEVLAVLQSSVENLHGGTQVMKALSEGRSTIRAREADKASAKVE